MRIWVSTDLHSQAKQCQHEPSTIRKLLNAALTTAISFSINRTREAEMMSVIYGTRCSQQTFYPTSFTRVDYFLNPCLRIKIVLIVSNSSYNCPQILIKKENSNSQQNSPLKFLLYIKQKMCQSESLSFEEDLGNTNCQHRLSCSGVDLLCR